MNDALPTAKWNMDRLVTLHVDPRNSRLKVEILKLPTLVEQAAQK